MLYNVFLYKHLVVLLYVRLILYIYLYYTRLTIGQISDRFLGMLPQDQLQQFMVSRGHNYDSVVYKMLFIFLVHVTQLCMFDAYISFSISVFNYFMMLVCIPNYTPYTIQYITGKGCDRVR